MQKSKNPTLVFWSSIKKPDSPMDFAYLSGILLDKNSDISVYIQFKQAICDLIKKGILKPGVKLPSSRQLADYLGVHRQTVIAGIEELKKEDWIITDGRKGTFVNEKLPIMKPRTLGGLLLYPSEPQFSYKYHNDQLTIPGGLHGFDDGFPDARLAPAAHLAKAYQEILVSKSKNRNLSISAHPFGSLSLREAIANELTMLRGLPIEANNVFITQGTQMTFFLLSNILLTREDKVIVTKPNYLNANRCFEECGAKLLAVGVDGQGMNVEEVQMLCEKNKISCVYVTPHHHDPTTVSMSSNRRKKLLSLAEQYGFVIIEDDYDYHYHFENKPMMPIASLDKLGHVIYMGSFAKVLSHNVRLAYIVAPSPVIKSLAIFRNKLDRYGDIVLEDAVAKLMKNQVLENHIRRNLAIYRQRRDDSYNLIQEELGQYLKCTLPKGGLAFWAEFEKSISLPQLSEKCRKQGLYFPDGTFYNAESNSCRMGFGSMNTKEMIKAVGVVKAILGR